MSQPMDSSSDVVDGQIVNQASLVNSEGGDVHLTIHGNVNVIAGQAGSTSHPESAREHERSVEIAPSESTHVAARLCDAMNQETYKKVMRNGTANFENLNQLDFEVYPQMRKVKNFFEGGYEHCDEEIFIEEAGGSRKRKVKSQTREEMGFYYHGEQEGDEIITKDQLVKIICSKTKLRLKDRNPVTAVVASAGAGKTTLLRRIAAEVLNSSPTFHHEDKSNVKESHLKMICYIDMKDIRFEGNITPSQFIFRGCYRTEREEGDAYEWLIHHQDEAILFFDGLDQAAFGIDESSRRDLRPYDTGTASEIMYNILTRNLLSHAKVVIASREFKVSELPAQARQHEIISLLGFNREDAKKLFISLINENGARIWEDIERLSPRLLNILSVPVFLVLTAAIMTLDPDAPPPMTITDLYNRILLSLPAVENIHEGRIKEVISKLKAMAHHGMKEGRVVFQEADLKKFDLSLKEVQDLMIKVPGNKRLTRHLVKGLFDFFCHQSFQEFLCASYVAEMPLHYFSSFNNSQLHTRRWSVVRTFVSGIIHDESTSELHEVSDPGIKRQNFARSVLSQVEAEKNGTGLLTAIYESNDDKLIRSLPRLPSMSGSTIGHNEAFMLGSVLARRSGAKEQLVDLYNCGLNDEHIDTIVQNLKKDRRIQVDDLDLRLNSFTTRGLNTLLSYFDTNQVFINYTRISAFRYGQLDWKNIQRISWYSKRQVYVKFPPTRIAMIKTQTGVSIEGLINGNYNEQERKLTLQKKTKSHVLDLMIFFEQRRFESQYQVYVTEAKLVQMKTLEMQGKISEMLFDCRSRKPVDAELIVSNAKTFGVTRLDILVSNNTSFIPSNFLKDIGSHDSLSQIDVNIHWWFNLAEKDDLKELFSFVSENKVKNLRLRCSELFSSEDISTVIRRCKIDKLAVRYWDVSKDFYAKEKENQESLRELAQKNAIKYEFVDREKFTEEIQNAWEEANRIWIKEL